MTFRFQRNNYANEHETRRRFHHQHFSCSSDLEETRHVSSFFKSYNSRTFSCESYLQDNTSLAIFVVFVLKAKFSFKIAAPGEGRKPSCEQYIAESEFALLGILSKQCLMIHFYFRCMPVDNTDRSGNNNKRLTFSDAKSITRM